MERGSRIKNDEINTLLNLKLMLTVPNFNVCTLFLQRSQGKLMNYHCHLMVQRPLDNNSIPQINLTPSFGALLIGTVISIWYVQSMFPIEQPLTLIQLVSWVLQHFNRGCTSKSILRILRV